MKPLISVLVPIYNVSEFLDNCIQSIINQSYENLEILLLDDGSTDNSGQICDKYSEKDCRIKVIHKKNSGVADTRNYGLSISSGEYYCFVDGDDYVHRDYVYCMYELLHEKNADISMCAYLYVWKDGRSKRTKNAQFSDDYICTDSGKTALREMLYSGKYVPSCCGKLFSRKTIGNIFFPTFSIGEDVLASVNYYLKAEKVAYSNRPLYYYLQNDNSVMHKFNPDKIFDNVLSSEEIYKKAVSADITLKKPASYYVVEKNLIVLMKLYGKNGFEDKIKHISQNIKKHRTDVITDLNAPIMVKAACVISFLGIKNLCRIRNIMS